MTTGIQVGDTMFDSDDHVVTERLYEAVLEARPVLAARAATRYTISYGDLVSEIGMFDGHNNQSVGKLLDGLSWDCQVRGEPNFVALIVNAKGEVESNFVDYWADKTGRTMEEERELLREWWLS